MCKEPLGAAVIGLRMGRRYLDAFERNTQIRIIGICDPDNQRLQETKACFNPDLTASDYREILNRDDIRIVAVASPDHFHAEQSIAAVRAGKDVICEKPLTQTLAESRAIIAAVAETGRKFMVGQVCRYAPGFVLAKSLVERGKIGDLFLVESEYAHSYHDVKGVGNWRVNTRREHFVGGGCHAVDLLRWVAGEMEEVFAYANHKCLTDWPVNDCFMAAYRFQSGVIGKVMVSTGCVRPYTMRSVFYGTEGTIICDNTSPEIQLCTRANCEAANIKKFGGFAKLAVNIKSHNVSAEVDEFVDCILNDKPILTDVREGARTVAACVAAVKSVKTGQPVRIERIA